MHVISWLMPGSIQLSPIRRTFLYHWLSFVSLQQPLKIPNMAHMYLHLLTLFGQPQYCSLQGVCCRPWWWNKCSYIQERKSYTEIYWWINRFLTIQSILTKADSIIAKKTTKFSTLFTKIGFELALATGMIQDFYMPDVDISYYNYNKDHLMCNHYSR